MIPGPVGLEQTPRDVVREVPEAQGRAAKMLEAPLDGLRQAVGQLPTHLRRATYLVSASLLPVGSVAWVFAESSRWSTVVMGVAALAVAVMVWRMHVIWTMQ